MGLAMFGLFSSPLVEELFTKENVQILKIKKNLNFPLLINSFG